MVVTHTGWGTVTLKCNISRDLGITVETNKT